MLQIGTETKIGFDSRSTANVHFCIFILLDMTDYMTNGMANQMRKDIHEQVILRAYDTVVDLSCPHLPRDCQLEIIRMLIPTRIRLPLSFIQN